MKETKKIKQSIRSIKRRETSSYCTHKPDSAVTATLRAPTTFALNWPHQHTSASQTTKEFIHSPTLSLNRERLRRPTQSHSDLCSLAPPEPPLLRFITRLTSSSSPSFTTKLLQKEPRQRRMRTSRREKRARAGAARLAPAVAARIAARPERRSAHNKTTQAPRTVCAPT